MNVLKRIGLFLISVMFIACSGNPNPVSAAPPQDELDAGTGKVYGQDRAANSISAGVRLMDLGEYNSAIRVFNTVLSNGISDDIATFITILECRADSYRLSEQYASAISDYTELIRLMSIYFPENNVLLADFFCRRGRSYQLNLNSEEALNDLSISLKISPSALAYNYRARSYMARYFDIINNHKDNVFADAEIKNTIIEFKNYNYEHAYSDFQESLKIDPDNKLAKEGYDILKFLKEKMDAIN